MAQEEKQFQVPLINVNHNANDTGLEIRVDLAGASKESIELDTLPSTAMVINWPLRFAKMNRSF